MQRSNGEKKKNTARLMNSIELKDATTSIRHMTDAATNTVINGSTDKQLRNYIDRVAPNTVIY